MRYALEFPDWFSESVRLHAKLPAYRRKIEKARQTMSVFLSTAPVKRYVSVSGGKDSTVILALAREQCPDIAAICSHDEFLAPETEQYLKRIDNLITIAGPHTHDGGFRTWRNGRPDDLPDWITWIGGDNYPLETYVEQNRYRSAIIGLRAEEAARRKVLLKSRGTIVWKKNGQVHGYPLAFWTDMDVWAYILSTGIDYNRAYAMMCNAGLDKKHWRTGPWWNSGAMNFGSISVMQRLWPEYYAKFKLESDWHFG